MRRKFNLHRRCLPRPVQNSTADGGLRFGEIVAGSGFSLEGAQFPSLEVSQVP